MLPLSCSPTYKHGVLPPLINEAPHLKNIQKGYCKPCIYPQPKKNITLNQTQLKTDILTHTHLHSAKTNSHLSTSTQTFPKEKLHPPIIIPPKKFKSIHTLEKIYKPSLIHMMRLCNVIWTIYMSLYVLFLDLLQAFHSWSFHKLQSLSTM